MMAFSRMRWLLGFGLLIVPPSWANWKTLGPFGGSAWIVATDPNLPKTLIAGTDTGLLFRSQDSGESWSPLPFPARMRATLHTLVIDPRTPGVYFAGLSSDLPEYSGILRSTDAGASWQQVPALRNRQVRAIAFWRGNSHVLLAGTEIGVFESGDGGDSWSSISPAGDSLVLPIVSLAIDPTDSKVIYAGTPHLPWKTTDGGATWSSIHNGFYDDSDVFSIQVDRNRPQRVFASACSGIYRSLNGGASWTRLHRALDASDRTYFVTQDPQYENVWFAGTTHGMMKSNDGGDTWSSIVPLATRAISYDLGRLGRIFIATEEDGILRSDDWGRTWRGMNRGFCARYLDALWIGSDDGRLYVAINSYPSNRLLRLDNSTDEWEELPIAARTTEMALPVTMPVGGKPFRELQGSRISLAAQHLSSSDGPPGESIQAICSYPNNPHWLFAARFGAIFSSRDGGRSWIRISPSGWPVISVKQLVVVEGPPDRLFVLSWQQGVYAVTLDEVLEP